MAGITDVHVHVQPFRMLKPGILDAINHGHRLITARGYVARA